MATMALTLLHEALHIYFGPLIEHGERGGGYGNASCYERFVTEIAGLRLHPATVSGCRATLRRGSRGPEVRILQRELNFWIRTLPLTQRRPLLVVNGVFDRPTEAAVRAFQRRMDLKKVDGVVGSETWGVLLPRP
jgi:hypothetical protein